MVKRISHLDILAQLQRDLDEARQRRDYLMHEIMKLETAIRFCREMAALEDSPQTATDEQLNA